MKQNICSFLRRVALLFLITTCSLGMLVKADMGTAGKAEQTEVGVAVFVTPTEESLEQIELARQEAMKYMTDLVMANVKKRLNVREEPNENAKKVGYLYKDCGGKILELRDGWTKLQSGDLIGWASDEYLLFNREAQELAAEVGNTIVTVDVDSLRIRKEPNANSGVYATLEEDEELDVIEVVNDDWIRVEYEGENGYVSSEFVTIDYHIDAGETMEVVKERERIAKEEKKKNYILQGQQMAAGDDLKLLGALIQCEAGNQPEDGQLAVGAVVMNRVKSPAYPDTISGVIFASGQFTPAFNGRLIKAYEKGVKQSCLDAAARAIAGETSVGAAMHFRSAGQHEGIVVGNHVFW